MDVTGLPLHTRVLRVAVVRAKSLGLTFICFVITGIDIGKDL